MVTLLFALLLGQSDDLEAVKERFSREKSLPAVQRTAALVDAGDLRNEPAAAFLAEVFGAEKDPAVRAAALHALGACGTDSSLETLAAAAGNVDHPLPLRIAALEALTHPPTPQGFTMARTLIRKKDEMRAQAWAALRLYPLEKTDPLWRSALEDADFPVRAMAMTALAPLKETPLADEARRILLAPNEHPILRRASVTVLQATGGVGAARLFVAAAASADPALRRALSEALGALNDDKSAEETYAALRHPNSTTRVVAARALGRLNHPQAAGRLSEPIKDKSVEVRCAALESVAERKDANSEAILQREAQTSNEDVAGAAINLLPAFPSDATKALLVKLADSHKPGLAIPAMEALGELGAAETIPALEKVLKTKEWPLRIAATRTLSRLRTREAVDVLVDRMAEEQGRLLAETGDALERVTGKPFGYAPGRWKEWWSTNRASFQPAAPGDLAAAAAAAGVTTYHGIPVLSTRMVFCTDISGSMADSSNGEPRMNQAKKELSKVLGQLSKDAQLNLIFFDDRVEPWHRQLVSIRPNLATARALIDKLAPRGRTNIFDALDAAFQHKEADTIYLLSDGDPTDGRLTDPEEILREIRRINRSRQIAIHSVSFGPSPFMKALAQQNAGRYVEMK